MTKTIGHTTIELVRGSVLDQDVEAIGNAASTSLRGGGGVDGAIHQAAGRELMEELQRVAPHGAKTGTVVVTGGHRLPQNFIFHTPGPVWNGGKKGEPDLLAACYLSCLEAADANQIASLGFCSISTGVYRYPIELAAPLAVRTVEDYLRTHLQTTLSYIIFAMFQAPEFNAFHWALQETT